MGAAAAEAETDEGWGDWEGEDVPVVAEKPPTKADKPKADKPEKSLKADKPLKEAKAPKSEKGEKVPKEAKNKEGKTPKPDKEVKADGKSGRIGITGVKVGDQLLIRAKYEGVEQGFNKKHFKGIIPYDFRVSAYTAPYANKKEIQAALAPLGYKLVMGEDDAPVPEKAPKAPKAPKAEKTPKAPKAVPSGVDAKALRLAIRTQLKALQAAIKVLAAEVAESFKGLEASTK